MNNSRGCCRKLQQPLFKRQAHPNHVQKAKANKPDNEYLYVFNIRKLSDAGGIHSYLAIVENDRRFSNMGEKFSPNNLETMKINLLLLIRRIFFHHRIAFPQEECLDSKSGVLFFSSQTYCGVAEEKEEIFGLYILHPNNVGRCAHIANASYAVSSASRGRHIGEMLAKDSLEQAHNFGFRILQFNAVVETNIHARHLYERLGFQQLGTIPGGFRLKDGNYANICPYYHLV